MAYLLAWVGFNGRQIEESLWRAMVEQLHRRAPLSDARMAYEIAQSSSRAYAIKVIPGEPLPLRRLDDGGIMLCDSRFEPGADATTVPGDEPAALIVLDARQSSIRVLRDRLGQQPLLWVRVKDGILVASKESILLAHPEVSRGLDMKYLAAHLAQINPEPGRSLYRHMRVVEPGTRVDIDARIARTTQLDSEPEDRAFGLSDRQACERYRELLQASVIRACQGAGKLGITLSAGLDSSSVLALLPSRHRNRDTVAVNYGTDFAGSVDERGLARELADLFGIRCESLDAANWPAILRGFELPPDPGHPYVNPYRALNAAVYGALRANGVEVFLTGHFADFWNPGQASWLMDALRNRRVDLIVGGYRHLWKTEGLRGCWGDPGWRHLARRWLWRRRARGPAWMRPQWREYVAACLSAEQGRYADWPHPEKAADNLGSAAALDGAYEGHLRDQFGLQSRHPYRDWHLLRFSLSLPAYQSQRGSQRKWIARAALADVLPPKWSQRPKQGGLLPFLEELAGSGPKGPFPSAVASAREIWADFIEPGEIERRMYSNAAPAFADGLLWLLAGFGSWAEEQALA